MADNISNEDAMTKTQNAMELWLRLMSDAMRGAADAQEAMRSLGEMPMTPDQMAGWMVQFMPVAAAQISKPEMSGDWLEDTWRMMGVVPRYRYLELLERYELLRQKLEQAEKTIQKMRKATSGGKMPEQDAQQVLDMWEGMIQETLSMQAEWMRGWTSTDSTTEKGEETKNPTNVGSETSGNEESQV
jgi:hypothetical protein